MKLIPNIMKTPQSRTSALWAIAAIMFLFFLHVVFKSRKETSPVLEKFKTESVVVREQINPMISYFRQASDDSANKYISYHSLRVPKSLLTDLPPNLTLRANQERLESEAKKMHEYSLDMRNALMSMSSQGNPKIVSRLQEAVTHFFGRLNAFSVEYDRNNAFIFTGNCVDYQNLPCIIYTNHRTWKIIRGNDVFANASPIFYLPGEKKIMICNLERMPGTLYAVLFANALYDGFLQETGGADIAKYAAEFDRVIRIRLEVANQFSKGKYHKALVSTLRQHPLDKEILFSFEELRNLDKALFIEEPQGAEMVEFLLSIHMNSLALVANELETQKSDAVTVGQSAGN